MQKDRINVKCSVGNCVGNYSPRLDEQCLHVLGINYPMTGVLKAYSEDYAAFPNTFPNNILPQLCS